MENSEPISDVNRDHKPDLNPDLNRLARYGLLRPYLRQQLLEELARSVALTKEELLQSRSRFFEEHGIENAEDAAAYCQRFRLTAEDFAYQCGFAVAMTKYCDEHFGAKAESRFIASKQSLDQVVYSLLRTGDGGLARELYLQVLEGEANFADLAALHAEGPERSTRGIVGPVPLSQGHPQLVDRLRTAEPGLLLEPFQIENWWLLVRVETVMPATYGPEAADAMKQRLLEEWLEEEVDRRLLQLPPLPAPVHS